METLSVERGSERVAELRQLGEVVVLVEQIDIAVFVDDYDGLFFFRIAHHGHRITAHAVVGVVETHFFVFARITHEGSGRDTIYFIACKDRLAIILVGQMERPVVFNLCTKVACECHKHCCQENYASHGYVGFRVERQYDIVPGVG